MGEGVMMRHMWNATSMKRYKSDQYRSRWKIDEAGMRHCRTERSRELKKIQRDNHEGLETHQLLPETKTASQW
jgi:hypothetical protein